MTKLELILIAIILLCLGGIFYVGTHKTPPPPDYQQAAFDYKQKTDSLLEVVKLKDDSIFKFKSSLVSIKGEIEKSNKKYVIKKNTLVALPDDSLVNFIRAIIK